MSSTRQSRRSVGDPNSPAHARNRSGDSLGSGGGVGGTNSSSSSSRSSVAELGLRQRPEQPLQPGSAGRVVPLLVVGLDDGLAGGVVVQLDPVAVVVDDGAPGVLVAVALHGTERTPVAERARVWPTGSSLGGGSLEVGGVFYWFLKWVALGPVLRLVFRPQVTGAEHVPASGPAILASNHLSYADWLFMPLTLPRRVTFVAKAEYFNTPGIKGWFQKKFFSGAGQVPIDRSGASAAEGALSAAKRILTEEGDLFGIYPEGTRSHDGKLYRGKTGVARLALECKVPVIPVAVVGTDVVAPPGQTFGKFTRPIVRFGKPLDFSRYEGMENDRYILRSITDEIMYEIMRLSGQEYVDMYANRAKEESKKAADAAESAAESAAVLDELNKKAS